MSKSCDRDSYSSDSSDSEVVEIIFESDSDDDSDQTWTITFSERVENNSYIKTCCRL
jgi:hypothetical protein